MKYFVGLIIAICTIIFIALLINRFSPSERYCITSGGENYSTTHISSGFGWIHFQDEKTGHDYSLAGTYHFFSIPIAEQCKEDK
jgi:hypothetical protein